MSAPIASFPRHAPSAARRPVRTSTCPLCGTPMRAPAGLFDAVQTDGCRLGICVADPEPGSIEHRIIERNREILRGDLVDVEFSLSALSTAIATAKERGTPCGPYIEQSFPLAMRRRILRGYMR